MALDNVRVLPVPAGAWQGLGGNVYSGNVLSALRSRR
jgi:hypothetical protein